MADSGNYEGCALRVASQPRSLPQNRGTGYLPHLSHPVPTAVILPRVSSFKIYLRFLLRNQNKKSRRPGNEYGPNGCTMRGESTHILHLKIESVYNSCAEVRRSESSRLFST